MIYISRLKVKNYRRFVDIDVPLKPHTVIIGENNSGKTSLLQLIDTVLNPTRRGFYLEEDDFTHGLDHDTSKVEVEIEIRPWPSPIFGTEERARLDPHIDVLSDGNERICLKLEHEIDEQEGTFRTRVRFIKSDGEDNGPFLPNLRRYTPFFMIPALRSAARDILNRNGIWGRLASSVQLEEDKRKDISLIAEDAAQNIMQLVLGDQAFSDAIACIRELFEEVLWPNESDGSLSFSTLSPTQKDLLQSIQILIKNPGDLESMGILDHGDGTQSISVVSLMLAYISAVGFPNAALAVEEPENHLHPHAARNLIRYLWNRPHQVLITTHSTHVTDVVSPDEIIVLKRQGSSTSVQFVPNNHFSQQELRELRRHIRSAGSEFFFAKSVLLTEGATEISALPIFANALSINLDRLGVSLVEVGGSNFRPFIRLFDPGVLDISHLIMCDNDRVAVDVANILYDLGRIPFKVSSESIDSQRSVLEENGLYFLPSGCFEEYVMSEGNIETYEEAIAQVNGPTILESYIRRRIRSDGSYTQKSRTQQIMDFIERSGRKPELAFEVANIITQDGTDSTQIPPYFVTVLKAIEADATRQLRVSDGDSSTGA